MAAHRPQPILNLWNTWKARDYGRELVDLLNHYSEEELRSRYQFGGEGINFIVEWLSDEIAPSTRRNRCRPRNKCWLSYAPKLPVVSWKSMEIHFHRTVSQRSVDSFGE